MIDKSLRLIAAAAVLLSPVAVADPAAYSFEIVAESGGRFDSFGTHASINCAADVAFSAASGASAGTFARRGGKLVTIHERAGSIPDYYVHPTINDAGIVAVRVDDQSGNALLTLGDGGRPIEANEWGHGVGTPAFNNAGQVAYIGYPANALFINDGRRALPLFPPQSRFRTFVEDSVAIDDSGTVTFSGTLNDGTTGLFIGDSRGTRTIFDARQMPGLRLFSTPAVNNAGTVVFRGQTGPNAGIYKDDGDGARLLIDNSGAYAALGLTVSINGEGRIAFSAAPRQQPDALGIFTGADAAADRVIVPGEKIGGRTVSELDLGTSALNDRGQIVFRASFADGRQAIVIATPAGAKKDAAECARPGAAVGMPAAAPHPYRLLADSLGESRWIESERERSTKLLQKAPADVLVIPFQAGGHTLDATGRSLLARRLAADLAAATGLRVADVGLVEQALGEPARSVAREDVFALGRQLGAKMVVIGSVRHDRAYRMSIELDIWRGEAGQVDANARHEQLRWRDVEFSDTQLPSSVFSPLAAEAIATITGKPFRPARPARAQPADTALAESFAALAEQAQRSPLDAASTLELLGSLHPTYIVSRARERLFERALVELGRVSSDSPGHRLLQARALQALHRRPAALAALGKPQTPAERALLAYMNGNLPQLEAAVAEIEEPVLRLMAELDLQLIASAYSQPPDQARLENVPGSGGAWAGFIARRFLDGDRWSNYSNAWTKIALEALAPTASQRFEDYWQARLAAGDPPAEADIARVVMAHVQAGFRDAKTADLGVPGRPSVIDLYELGMSITLANAISEAQTLAGVKALPREGLDVLAAYAPVFADHPLLLIEQATIMQDKDYAAQMPPLEQKRIADEVGRLSARGLIWLAQQDPFTVWIAGQAAALFPEAGSLTPEGRGQAFYFYDFPQRIRRQEFFARDLAEQKEMSRHCMAYVNLSMSCVMWESANLKDTPEKRAELYAELEQRFIGHPQRAELMIALRREMGEQISQLDYYAAAIESDAQNWEVYLALGKALVGASRYAEARDTFLKYPGFNGKRLVDNVSLSNAAYRGGSLLYWAGAWREAMPLYQIAAELETGSEAGYAAAQRLALLERDWAAATEIVSRRARRYDSGYAQRDHMALLHMTGEAATAWAMFDHLTQSTPNPQHWTAAYAGHRMAGSTEQQIIDWALDPRRARHDGELRDQAPIRFVLRMFLIDRQPPADLIERLHRLDERIQLRPVAIPPPVDERAWQIGREIGEFTWLSNHARAMAYFHHGDMKNAFAWARPSEHSREFLPFVAWASLIAGETKVVEDYLKGAEKRTAGMDEDGGRSFRFYDALVRAQLSGFRGQHEQALAQLRTATNDRPFTEREIIFTDYQLVETVERLYVHTGEDAYRAFGFDLVQRFEHIDPMYPWIYAMGAKLAPSAKERLPYLATAMQMDPHSWRVSQFSETERKAAAEWLAANGTMTQPKTTVADALKL